MYVFISLRHAISVWDCGIMSNHWKEPPDDFPNQRILHSTTIHECSNIFTSKNFYLGYSHPHECEVVSHFGFDLHYLWKLMTIFHVLFAFCTFSLGKFYSDHFPILKLVCLLLWVVILKSMPVWYTYIPVMSFNQRWSRIFAPYCVHFFTWLVNSKAPWWLTSVFIYQYKQPSFSHLEPACLHTHNSWPYIC